MKILEFNLIRESPCSAYVAWWNTWDHEHLYFVHHQFSDSKIISESASSVVIRTNYTIPIFRIRLVGFHCMFHISESHCRVIDYLPFGLQTITDIHFEPVGANSCCIRNRYQVNGPAVFYPLRVVLPRLIMKWNRLNWEEDLELKNRRTEAISKGFRDFWGVDSGYNKEADKDKYKLPLPRLRPSVLDFSPWSVGSSEIPRC